MQDCKIKNIIYGSITPSVSYIIPVGKYELRMSFESPNAEEGHLPKKKKKKKAEKQKKENR